MKYRALIAVMILGPIFLVAEARAAALPDRDAVLQFGAANKAATLEDPMRIVVSEKDPADPTKLIERDVVVTDIPKYVRPTQNVGENLRDYLLRVKAAQEAHSKLKAEKIAAAINTTLGNGRATATQSNNLSNTNAQWNLIIPGNPGLTPIKNGEVTVTGAHKVVYGPSKALIKVRTDEIKAAIAHNRNPANVNNQIPVPKPLTNNNTGENGDSVKVKPGQPILPSPSPGLRGSLGTMEYDLTLEFPGEFPGIPMVATGLDVDGLSSIFDFGILGTYVASVQPFAGQTDEEIYLALKSLLDTNGLPSTYDPSKHMLFLDGYFGDADELYFAVTDTGFSDYLTVSYGVPEPESFILLSMGLASLAWLRRRSGAAFVRAAGSSARAGVAMGS